MLQRTLFVPRLLVGACCLHATVIEAMNYNRKLEPEFLLGSADSLVMENLKAGDIIVFSRKWYLYHLPVGAMIMGYKFAFGTEFDHAGVIVEDKYGTPNVLEKTPFRGYQCRPFQERIRNSKARHILVVPVIQPQHDESTVSQKQNLRYHAERAVKDQTVDCFELYECGRSLATNHIRSLCGLSKASNEGPILCHNSVVILRALSAMIGDLEPIMNSARSEDETNLGSLSRTFSLKNILDRSVQFEGTDESDVEDRVLLASHDVFIRSS